MKRLFQIERKIEAENDRDAFRAPYPHEAHPSEAAGLARKKVRLAYLVSHPIQYQAPLLRRIAQEPDIDLTVFFGSDFSVREYNDEGFGVGVKWDVPLLDGYSHEFLAAIARRARGRA